MGVITQGNQNFLTGAGGKREEIDKGCKDHGEALAAARARATKTAKGSVSVSTPTSRLKPTRATPQAVKPSEVEGAK